jgi:hypothetical protein
MTKFHRTIAILILALFTCQFLVAGFGEHGDHASDANVVNGLHFDYPDLYSSAGSNSDQPITPQFIDGDCCHAHGHCHLLAFSGQVASVSIPPLYGLAMARGDTYVSLSPNTLLRPPTHA